MDLISKKILILNHLRLKNYKMTPENFCYWLQGYFELAGETPYGSLTREQVEEVKNHLALVFNKVTPNVDYSESNICDSKITTFPVFPEFSKPIKRCGPAKTLEGDIPDLIKSC